MKTNNYLLPYQSPDMVEHEMLANGIMCSSPEGSYSVTDVTEIGTLPGTWDE